MITDETKTDVTSPEEEEEELKIEELVAACYNSFQKYQKAFLKT